MCRRSELSHEIPQEGRGRVGGEEEAIPQRPEGLAVALARGDRSMPPARQNKNRGHHTEEAQTKYLDEIQIGGEKYRRGRKETCIVPWVANDGVHAKEMEGGGGTSVDFVHTKKLPNAHMVVVCILYTYSPHARHAGPGESRARPPGTSTHAKGTLTTIIVSQAFRAQNLPQERLSWVTSSNTTEYHRTRNTTNLPQGSHRVAGAVVEQQLPRPGSHRRPVDGQDQSLGRERRARHHPLMVHRHLCLSKFNRKRDGFNRTPVGRGNGKSD